MASSLTNNTPNEHGVNESLAGYTITHHPFSHLEQPYTVFDASNVDWNRRRFLPAAAASNELVARNKFLEDRETLLEELAARDTLFLDVSLYTSTIDPSLDESNKKWLVDNPGLLTLPPANNRSVASTATRSLQGYYPELIGDNYDRWDEHWTEIDLWSQIVTSAVIMDSEDAPFQGPDGEFSSSTGNPHEPVDTSWMVTHGLEVSAPADDMNLNDDRPQCLDGDGGYKRGSGDGRGLTNHEESTLQRLGVQGSEVNYRMNRSVELPGDIFQYYDPQDDHDTTHSPIFYNGIGPVNLQENASQQPTRSPNSQHAPGDPIEQLIDPQFPLLDVRRGVEENIEMSAQSQYQAQLYQDQLPDTRNEVERNPWRKTQSSGWMTVHDSAQSVTDLVAPAMSSNPSFAQRSFSQAPPVQAPPVYAPPFQFPIPEFTHGLAPDPYQNIRPSNHTAANPIHLNHDTLMATNSRQNEDNVYVRHPDEGWYFRSSGPSKNTHVGQDLAELHQPSSDHFVMNAYNMVIERQEDGA